LSASELVSVFCIHKHHDAVVVYRKPAIYT
jgi:hypothetical protein